MSSTPALDSLTKSIRSELQSLTQAASATIIHAIKVGEYLTEAKALVAHGSWTEWLESGFTLSARSAQRFMQLAASKDRFVSLDKGHELPSLRQAIQMLAEPREETASIDPKPLAIFEEFTDLGHDETHVNWLKDHFRPWVEKGYIPIISHHAERGWIWHTLLTPDGAASKKPVALLFDKPECLEEMTDLEHEHLHDLENLVKQNLDGAIATYVALVQVRDRKLYRDEHESFDSFLRVRGMTEQQFDEYAAVYQPIVDARAA